MNYCFSGFQTLVKKNGKYYFPSFFGHSLFSYNGNRIVCEAEFPIECGEVSVSLFGESGIYKDELYFIPHTASELVFYNIYSHSIRKIRLEGVTDHSVNFYNSILEGDTLWLLPTRFQGILEIDLLTGKQTVYADWCDAMLNKPNSSEFRLSKHGFVRRGSTLFLSSAVSGKVLEFDIVSHKSTIHDFPGNGYAALCDDGLFLWLISCGNGEICRWNPETGERVYFGKIYQNNPCPEVAGCIFDEGLVYVFPYFGKKVVRINCETGLIEEVKCFNDIVLESNIDFSLWATDYLYADKLDNNRIVICTGRNMHVYLYYIKENCLEDFQQYMPDETGEVFKSQIYKVIKEKIVCNKEAVIIEDGYVDFRNFLFFLKGMGLYD